LTQAAYSHR
ncbi:hypothetical protein ECPA38_4526, partial [Escherichia coli PA38]